MWEYLVTTAWENKKWPLSYKRSCKFFLYAMFYAQSRFLLAHFRALTRFLLRATELGHDAGVLSSIFNGLVFHYTKSILFNFILSMRFKTHAYTCDSCINTWINYHCLLYVNTAEMLTSPNFCTQFLVHSLVVACLSLTLMKLRTQPRAAALAQCFLFWYLFPFLVCWGIMQAGALSSYSSRGK